MVLVRSSKAEHALCVRRRNHPVAMSYIFRGRKHGSTRLRTTRVQPWKIARVPSAPSNAPTSIIAADGASTFWWSMQNGIQM
jgi:hypothetical protein